MFEQWTLFAAGFFGFVILGMIIYLLGSRPSRKDIPYDSKREVYIGGERYNSEFAGPGNFYRAITGSHLMARLRRLHSGSISDYVFWVVVASAFMIILVVVSFA
jgi:hypothetical protein